MKDGNHEYGARGPRIERLALCGAQSIRQAGRTASPARATFRLQHAGASCCRQARRAARIRRRA